jgi:hypothetical protein
MSAPQGKEATSVSELEVKLARVRAILEQHGL